METLSKRGIDYYPFGLTFNSYQREGKKGNRFLYNGKERQEETGWYDYGFRQYDPALGRWHVKELLADLMTGISTYAYAYNNPVNFVDHFGLSPGPNPEAWDIMNNQLHGIENYMETGLSSGPPPEAWKTKRKGNKKVSSRNVMGADGKKHSVTSNDIAQTYEVSHITEVPEQDLWWIHLRNGEYYSNSGLEQGGLNPEFYYNALDGLVLNNGSVVSRDDLVLTFNDDPKASARWHGFKNGKYHVNFDIDEYEITQGNVRAAAIHEIYGHGIKGFNGENHYKAYWEVIDSKYWVETTDKFRKNTAYGLWLTWTNAGNYGGMPQKYLKVIYNYHPYYKK